MRYLIGLLFGFFVGGLPYYVGGALFRLALVKPRRILVALLAACVLFFLFIHIDLGKADRAYQMGLQIIHGQFSEADFPDASARRFAVVFATACATSGMLLIPWGAAWLAALTVDRIRKRRGPNEVRISRRSTK